MAMLNTSANELRDLAKQLKLCSNALKQNVNTASQLLSAINTAWVGSELQSLTDRAYHSSSECLQLSDALAMLAGDLESASTVYQQTEQSLIQQIEDII